MLSVSSMSDLLELEGSGSSSRLYLSDQTALSVTMIGSAKVASTLLT